MNNAEFKTQERQYSDVVSSQQGVEDTSAATRMQGNAQAVSSINQQVAPMVADYKEQEAAKSTLMAQEQYYAGLKSETAMVEQGKSAIEIANYRTKVEQGVASVLGAEDRMTLRSKFEKLSMGGSLAAKTAAQMQLEADRETAFSMGIDENHPDYRQLVEERQTHLRNLKGNIINVMAGQQPVLVKELRDIANSPLSPSEKQNAIEILRGKTLADITKFAEGDEDAIKLGMSLATNLFDQFKTSSGADAAFDAEKLKGLESQAAIMTHMTYADQTVYRGLLAQPEVVQMAHKNLMLKMFQEATKKFVTSGGKEGQYVPIEKQREIKDKAIEAAKSLNGGSIDPTTPAGAMGIDILSESLKWSEDPTSVTPLVNSTMKSMTRYLTGIEDPKSNATTIKALSGPLGDWVNKHPEQVDPKVMRAMKSNLMTYTTDVIAPMVSEQFNRTISRGRTGRSIDPRSVGPRSIDPRSVDLVFNNGQVSFTDPHGMNQGLLTNLNRGLSGDITKTVKAYSNITGESPELVLQRLKGQFGVVPSETLPDQEKEAVAAPTSVEGGNPLDMMADQPVVEKVLEEVTIKDSEDPVVDAKIRKLVSGLDRVQAPELRYLLKRELAGLNDTTGKGSGTGGRTGGRTGRAKNKDKDISGKGRDQYEMEEAANRTVDWDFIEGREGFETKLYVPKKKGKVLGTSGVTVGMGIDLGTWGNKLEGLGVSPEIAEKLKPYAGKKGEEADKFLKANPLELSEEEAREVSQKVKSKLLDEIKTQFNKDANNDFEDLTRAQQTVVASVFFQYGMDKTREKWAKNFWKQVTEGRWSEAKKNLANFGDDYQSRRDLELEYLED